MSDGGTGTVPMQGTMGGQGGAGEPGAGGEGGDFLSSIPETYRDKPYMQGIDSQEKLLDQFDNAQKLIGQKTVGIPGVDASDDDWNKYYEKIRPESADKYEFDKVELPEGFDESQFDDKWTKDLFHKAGLTERQAKILKKDYDERYLGMIKDNQEKAQAQDTEFETMLDKHFGADKEKSIANVNKLLSDNVPSEFKESVKQLDNKSLMILTAALDSVHKKYISEDNPGGGDPTPTETPEEMRASAKKLMMSEAYKDVMHPNHEATKKQVNEVYQKIAKIGQK